MKDERSYGEMQEHGAALKGLLKAGDWVVVTCRCGACKAPGPLQLKADPASNYFQGVPVWDGEARDGYNFTRITHVGVEAPRFAVGDKVIATGAPYNLDDHPEYTHRGVAEVIWVSPGPPFSSYDVPVARIKGDARRCNGDPTDGWNYATSRLLLAVPVAEWIASRTATAKPRPAYGEPREGYLGVVLEPDRRLEVAVLLVGPTYSVVQRGRKPPFVVETTALRGLPYKVAPKGVRTYDELELAHRRLLHGFLATSDHVRRLKAQVTDHIALIHKVKGMLQSAGIPERGLPSMVEDAVLGYLDGLDLKRQLADAADPLRDPVLVKSLGDHSRFTPAPDEYAGLAWFSIFNRIPDGVPDKKKYRKDGGWLDCPGAFIWRNGSLSGITEEERQLWREAACGERDVYRVPGTDHAYAPYGMPVARAQQPLMAVSFADPDRFGMEDDDGDLRRYAPVPLSPPAADYGPSRVFLGERGPASGGVHHYGLHVVYLEGDPADIPAFEWDRASTYQRRKRKAGA